MRAPTRRDGYTAASVVLSSGRASVVCCVATLCVVVSPPLLSQQQQQSSPTFRSTANLLTLIASVVDEATGRPVGDLGAKDFTVTVAGVPATVRIADYVSVLGSDDAPASSTSPTLSTRAHQERTPRQLLFLVDDVSMTSEETIEIRNTLPRAFGYFESSDRIGLMTTSGLSTSVAPIAEREPVVAALGQVDGRLVDQQGAVYIGLDEAIEIARGFPLDTLTRVVARECAGLAGGAGLSVNCDDIIVAHAKRLAVESSERFRIQVGAVRRAIGVMATANAPRVLVWLSNGLADSADPDARRTLLRQLAEEAAASGVQMFALTSLGDESDVRNLSHERAAAWRRSRAAAIDGLRVVTQAAGGETFGIVGQADRFHQRIAVETAGYYRLAVDMPDASLTDAMIVAKVTVGRRGAVVRSSGRAWSGAPVAGRRTLKSVFESGVKSVDVPVVVAVQPRRHPSGEGQVQLVVEISTTPLTYPATVIFGLLDHKGSFVTAGQREVPTAGKDGVHLRFALTVFPGNYVLRVAVGDSGDAGRYGLAEFSVHAILGSDSVTRSSR